MKRTEIIALTGLAITATTIAVMIVNDNRLLKQEKGIDGRKPFMTREQQNKAMKLTLAKIALTGLVLTYVAMDLKKSISK